MTSEDNRELIELRGTVGKLIDALNQFQQQHRLDIQQVLDQQGRLMIQGVESTLAIARLEERMTSIKERFENSREDQKQQGRRLWYIFEKVIQVATTAGVIWVIVQNLI